MDDAPIEITGFAFDEIDQIVLAGANAGVDVTELTRRAEGEAGRLVIGTMRFTRAGSSSNSRDKHSQCWLNVGRQINC